MPSKEVQEVKQVEKHESALNLVNSKMFDFES